MINIIGKRFIYLWISIILFVVALIFLGVDGLKFGVEFSSGSILTVHFTEPVSQTDMRTELTNLGHGGTIVQQNVETKDYILRTKQLNKEEKAALVEALTARFGEVEEREFTTISPMVATQTAQNAAIAVAVACVGILIYLFWAFRRLAHSIHYAVCAIISLVHDVVIVLGVFAILGKFGWEINLMFITGVLAIIGYSVNNVVVIFDRIRENVRLGVSSDLATVVNNSVIETLGRGFNTSLTTVLTILAVLLFVGSSLQNFTVVLLVGVVMGVYSSLFIAPTLLVIWDKKEWGRIIGRSRKLAASKAG